MASEASSSTISSANFDNFNATIQTSALKATRNVLALPSDVTFHRSMDAEFANGVDSLSSRVLELANKVLTLVFTADRAPENTKGKEKLKSEDDVIDNFHSHVVDAMDKLLERTDISLDEFLGRIKPPSIAINPPKPLQKKPRTRNQVEPVIQHASHIQKPQLLFRRKPENNDSPWYPTLSHKYNAQVPLGYHYHDEEFTSDRNDAVTNHPYRYEIKHTPYPQRMFQTIYPSPSKGFEDTPFTWVSSGDDFQSMLAKLRHASEIAVDLEHHSYRSYSGFVCLMQISTREEDWIIDTLVLRDELTELNEVFTDPKIVKVFHGADSDIIWLQQDFNIYVVNLFDTFHASKILEFPRHGLANLLEMYCDFTPDKRYQLADWRIRPLPVDMLEYARSDTHFLLYVYDNLRNALLDRAQSRGQSRAQSPSGSQRQTPISADSAHALVKQVLQQSEETSLRVYEKEMYDAENGSGTSGWDTLARKWNKVSLMAGGPGVGVGALQRAIYQVMHKWRETVARKEDESTRYVLPNHFLFQLAEHPPTDLVALLGIFHLVPPLVRKYANELLELIRDCVKQHASSDILKSDLTVERQEPVADSRLDDLKHEQAKSDDTSLPGLWKFAPALISAAASSSSVPFTATSAAETSRAPLLYATSRTALFGSVSSGVFPSKPSSTVDPRMSPHFRDVVDRINNNLVIAPSVPKKSHEDEHNPIVRILDESTAIEVSGMQVEIPFIPASQRKTVQVVEDSIVTVGQARQRKRKRVKSMPSDGAASISAEHLVQKANLQNEVVGSKDEPDGHEPFDFSAVPNILDDNPNSEDTKQRTRSKKQKSGNTFYGDFPAPPKAYSELKRGNQSYTFKS